MAIKISTPVAMLRVVNCSLYSSEPTMYPPFLSKFKRSVRAISSHAIPQ